MQSDVFPIFVIGLAKFLDNGQTYPLPDELSYSLNSLSGAMLSNYPRTLRGLLELASRPLQSWWPSELPADFDPEGELVYDGDLAMGAQEYLDQFTSETNLPRGASLATLATAIDNRIFHMLLERLQQAALVDPVNAQSEYVMLRRFIIEHPWTTTLNLLDTFGSMRIIRPEDVGALYEEANPNNTMLFFTDDQGKSGYWSCDHCGPLRVRFGKLQSIKPSVCGVHCPRPQGWHVIEPNRRTRVLKKGIHLRTHIPGIHELALYRFLLSIREAHPKLLPEVQLWPGIDRYDLQICFCDSVWAIDVKDYKDPYQLGRNLSRPYGEGNLRWDKGFYVYPSYREKQRHNYGQIARREARALSENIQIISDEQFKARVAQKIEALARGE